MQQITDISILEPEGELDSHQGRLLLDQINTLLQFEWSRVVIDLSDVDHIDIKILPELLRAALFSANQFGGLKLANVGSYTRTLLRLAGIEGHFETYDSVADAVLSFGTPMGGTDTLQ